MKRISRITESDVNRIVKRIINEDKEKKEPLIQKIMRKIKGIPDKQLEYNMEHDLPWDWRGSKEGFYEKMEDRRKYSGSD
jgi:hypothetical protein